MVRLPARVRVVQPMTPLRLDDLGASSKLYERHRTKWRAYRELDCDDLADLGRWCVLKGATLTLAMTACWVERDGSLTPYHEKYPEQAAVIHYWARRGIFEIAAHGLTHCVPGRHRPSWIPWRGNRQWHREFIDYVPFNVQVEHLRRARAILEDRFMVPVTTLVPPGNAISERLAMDAVEKHGYSLVTCRARGRRFIVDDSTHTVLHDADLVRNGMEVLDRLPALDYQSVERWRVSKLGRVPHV